MHLFCLHVTVACQTVGSNIMREVQCFAGAVPVIGSSVDATGPGHASQAARKLCAGGGSPLKPSFWEAPLLEELLLDAALGVVFFKARDRVSGSLLG